MSRLFFHERIEKVIPLIRDGELEAAEHELSKHISSTAEDLSEDETAFSNLVRVGHEYLTLLQCSRNDIRRAKAQQLDSATAAIKPLEEALGKGKELVKLAHKVQQLTKKEELDID